MHDAPVRLMGIVSFGCNGHGSCRLVIALLYGRCMSTYEPAYRGAHRHGCKVMSECADTRGQLLAACSY